MKQQALEAIVRHFQHLNENVNELDIITDLNKSGRFYGIHEDLWSIHKKNICIESNEKANKVLKALLTEPAILTSIYDQCEYLSNHHYCHDCDECQNNKDNGSSSYSRCDDAYSQDTLVGISADSEQTILSVQKHLFPINDK